MILMVKVDKIVFAVDKLVLNKASKRLFEVGVKLICFGGPKRIQDNIAGISISFILFCT